MPSHKLPLLALISLIPVPVAAQTCDVETVTGPQPVALVLEPFAAVAPTGHVTLTLRAPDPRVLDLRFRADGQANTGAFAVTFEASSTDIPIRRLEDDRYRFELPAGQDVRLGFSIAATAVTVPPPGRTDLTFAVDAADAATGAVCLRETNLPIGITVPSRAEMNLAGASGAFDTGKSFYSIDFGAVRAGDERNVAVQFRANGDAALSFRSRNGGRMVSTTLPDYAIGYLTYLNGQSLPLTGETIVPVPPARSLQGTSLPLRIVIADVPPLPAGEYTDTITITISAIQ